MNQQKASTLSTRKIAYLLPALPVLFFFAHAIAQFTDLIFAWEVLFLFLIYTAAVYTLYVLLKYILKFPHTIALCGTTLLTTGFLFFGTLQDLLLGTNKLQFLGNSFFMLIAIFGGIIAYLIYAKWQKKKLYRFNLYLFVLFFLLTIYEVIKCSIIFGKGNNAYSIAERMTNTLPLPKQKSSQELPDIHYLVFDAYTNGPTLKKYWGYDNDIYSYLQSRGFYTIDSGHSNYISTPFSISSVLNLQYLRGAEPYLHSTSSNFFIGRRTYVNNALFKFLEKLNYSFSIFSQLEDRELLTSFGFLGVEKPVKWIRKLTLERLYLSPWIVEKFSNLFGKKDTVIPMIAKSMESFRSYNTKAIEHLNELCQPSTLQNIKPVFSFTHIMLPHDPYQVDENGTFIPTASPGNSNMDGYLQQLKYSNKLIKQITECLLSDKSRKKIIIIQGDHGFRHDPKAPAERQYDALSAFYFYDQKYHLLHKKFSHINTFRVIINNYYGGNLPLLQDSLKKLSRN